MVDVSFVTVPPSLKRDCFRLAPRKDDKRLGCLAKTKRMSLRYSEAISSLVIANPSLVFANPLLVFASEAKQSSYNNSGYKSMEQEQKVYSISEYLDLVNNGLKQFSVKIMGEVGKIGFGSTGHVYFSLRDEQDKSVMDCIIWAGKYKLYGINLQEGMKIIALGTPGIYKQTGRFSFVAESIELAGEGQLKKEYEKLKEKLQAEGVFDLANKRPLPMYPQRIGVITSKQGAVIGDFLSNIGKFGFKISMIDSRVEGQLAIFDLLGAIKTFRKK